MLSRLSIALLAATLVASGGVLAQVRVRTETIKPPTSATPPPANQFVPPAQGTNAPTLDSEAAAGPEIITDLSRLPPAVMRMRDRILAAARSGDPQKLLALMQASSSMPVFSHTQKQDPIAIWRQNYPDSEGVEILSILIAILETNLVRVDADTPQETYLWPYFARLPLKSLTPAQKVDLFRIITGSDYKDMLESDRYAFYRVGIGPDGTWRYFVAGD
jgi:hypothetical protein